MYEICYYVWHVGHLLTPQSCPTSSETHLNTCVKTSIGTWLAWFIQDWVIFPRNIGSLLAVGAWLLFHHMLYFTLDKLLEEFIIYYKYIAYKKWYIITYGTRIVQLYPAHPCQNNTFSFLCFYYVVSKRPYPLLGWVLILQDL